MEIWKDIQGYNGKYQVSNTGKVRSFSSWKKGGLLKFGKCGNPGPYFTVNLVGNGRSDISIKYVHRLVAAAFCKNPKGYKEVNHINADTTDNRAENLEWCSHAQNMKHASKNNLLSHDFEKGPNNKNSKPVVQMTKDGEFIKIWDSVNQIQRETPYLASSIFCCCGHKKHYKTAYGFRWEFYNGKTNNQNPQKKDGR